MSFNPLTGIRSLLIQAKGSKCFNPLTGIRSFLTYSVGGVFIVACLGFNPLTGIRS